MANDTAGVPVPAKSGRSPADRTFTNRLRIRKPYLPIFPAKRKTREEIRRTNIPAIPVLLYRWVVARMSGERSVLLHTASGKLRLRSGCMTDVLVCPGIIIVIRCAGAHRCIWTEDHLNSCMLPVHEFNHVDAAGVEQVIPTLHFHCRPQGRYGRPATLVRRCYRSAHKHISHLPSEITSHPQPCAGYSRLIS